MLAFRVSSVKAFLARGPTLQRWTAGGEDREGSSEEQEDQRLKQKGDDFDKS
jgi:hypothetical protein